MKLSERLFMYGEDCSIIEAATDMEKRVEQLESALKGLMTNPHLTLGDLVYTVREREGLGWDGPATTAWGNAVIAAEKAIQG